MMSSRKGGRVCDFIWQFMEYYERKGNIPVRPNQTAQSQPRTNYPIEKERKRKYAHDRDVLQNPRLPGWRHYEVHPGWWIVRRKRLVTARHWRACWRDILSKINRPYLGGWSSCFDLLFYFPATAKWIKRWICPAEPAKHDHHQWIREVEIFPSVGIDYDPLPCAVRDGKCESKRTADRASASE